VQQNLEISSEGEFYNHVCDMAYFIASIWKNTDNFPASLHRIFDLCLSDEPDTQAGHSLAALVQYFPADTLKSSLNQLLSTNVSRFLLFMMLLLLLVLVVGESGVC
jgi:hypothetical protein